MERIILSSLFDFYNSDMSQQIVSDVANTVNNLIDNRDSEILIIGVGEGYMEKFDNGNLFYAIPSMYPIKHWPKIRPFKTVVVDETSLPFLPKTFETIFVIHFLEFSKKIKDSLKEIFRILKPNGNLVIIIANKNNVFFSRKYSFLKNNIKYNTIQLIQSLSDASFSVLRAIGFNNRTKFWPYNFSYRFNKYNLIFVPFLPFLSDIVVLVSKKNEEVTEVIKVFNTKYETL